VILVAGAPHSNLSCIQYKKVSLKIVVEPDEDALGKPRGTRIASPWKASAPRLRVAPGTKR